MNTEGNMHSAIVLETESAQRQLNNMVNAARRAGVDMGSSFSNVARQADAASDAMKKIGMVVGGYISMQGLKSLATQVFNVRKEIQSLEISFETLLGNKAKADALFGSIRKFAVETPMQLKDLASAAQLMLSFNISEDKIMPFLKAIGDVSMGDAQKFQSLSLAFSQMSSAGKLMGQDLMQMINAGFNPLATMAEKTGKSISELKDEMSAGKITSEMVQQAFIDATSAGGKFYNMLQKQSKGLQGAMSNLQGAIDDMFNAIGEQSEGVMAGALDVATSLVKSYERVGRILLSLIATYGVYTAAVAVATMQTRGWTLAEQAHYAWLVLVDKAQKALNATMLKNPYVLAAAAIAAVVVALVSMKTETEMLKDAEEAYAKKKQDIIDKEQEHRRKVEELCDAASNESMSTEYRREKLVKLIQLYPEVFAKYKTETEMLEHIRDIKLEIAEIDGKGSIANPQNELADVEKRIAELEAKGKYVQRGFRQGQKNWVWDENLSADESAELKTLKNRRSQINRQAQKDNADKFLANLTGVSNEALQNEIDARKRLLQQLKDRGDENALGGITGSGASGTFSQSEIQGQLQLLEAEQAERAKATKTAQQWSKEYENAYKVAKKAYEDYLKSKDKVSEKEFQAESKRLKAEMDAARKKWKDYTSQSGKDDDKNAQKSDKDNIKIELLSQQQKTAEIRAAQDLQHSVAQAEIDAMAEGQAKVSKQRALDFSQRMQEIDRQREDLLQAKKDAARALWEADSKNEGKRFDDSSISLNPEEEASFSSLKRNTIAQYYNDVAAAIAQNQRSMTEYLSQYGQLQQRIEALRKLRDEDAAKATNEGERLKILAQYNQQIASLEIQASNTGSAIAALFGEMTDKTTKELDKLAKKGQEALDFLKGGKYDSKKGLELGISQETFDRLKDSPEELQRIAQAIREIKNQANDTRDPLEQVAQGIKDIFDAGSDTQKLTKALADLQGGLSKISSAVSVVSGAFSSLGEAFGSDFLSGVADTLNTAMDVADKTMQGAQAGAAFGPWGAAAGAAIGLVGSLGSALAKLHDAKHERAIQRIQEQIDVLEKSYDDLGRQIDKAYSKDASNLIEQQNKLLTQQRQLIRNQIAEEKQKKNSDEDRIKEWEAQIEEIDQTLADNKEKAIDAICGEDIQAAIERFANAYASMFEAGNSKAKAARDVVKTMIKNMVTALMKSDISSFMQEFRDKMLAYWTDNYIDSYEEAQLQQMAEDYMSQMGDKYSWADKYFKDAYSQSASSGAFQTMSQDTADELNGRFTALQIAQEATRTAAEAIQISTDSIASATLSLRDGMQDVININLLQLSELEEINQNTKRLKDIDEKLDKVERKTRDL